MIEDPEHIKLKWKQNRKIQEICVLAVLNAYSNIKNDSVLQRLRL